MHESNMTEFKYSLYIYLDIVLIELEVTQMCLYGAHRLMVNRGRTLITNCEG